MCALPTKPDAMSDPAAMNDSLPVRTSSSGGNRRIAVALTGSALLHIGLIAGVPEPLHLDFQLVNAAPPALSVRLVPAQSPPSVLAVAAPKYDARRRPVAATKARSETGAGIAEERQPVPPPLPEATPVPAPIETYPGVTVAQATYAGPLPPVVDAASRGEIYLRDGDLDERPVPLQMAVPEYPPEAVERKAGGAVLVALYLDEEGRVVDAAPVSASEELAEFGADIARALLAAEFTPALKDGQPVKSLVFQVVRLDPETVKAP
jgi:TonB family protein